MTLWQKSNNERNCCNAGNSSTKKFPLWTLGVGIGVLFLVFGFYGEQFTDIYRKAVMICLECIGIG